MAHSKRANRIDPMSETESNLPPQQELQSIVSQQWSGPLLAPAALAQFNVIIPNGAERIIAMVEQEQLHRIADEKKVLDETINDTRRGHWMGWVISMASLSSATLSVYLGAHPNVSVALVSIPVLGMIQSIVNSKSR